MKVTRVAYRTDERIWRRRWKRDGDRLEGHTERRKRWKRATLSKCSVRRGEGDERRMRQKEVGGYPSEPNLQETHLME